ncbi:DUF7373 family lipoprotein [Nocardia shimofusensis]|uniref:DUF7373 family lipoprotein n=1 Tax=Nocardia shimofusensis TaxID=228596 RepID=UPI000836B885|nr:hypothetical protein [Nocardia shimofusensis]
MRFGTSVLAVVTASVLAGCAAEIPGNPQPGQLPVDIAALNTGAYSPQPTGHDFEISTIGELRLVESRRMLEYLVSPSEIDSDISVAGPLALFSGPDIVGEQTFPAQYEAAAVDNNMLLGVYLSRINGNLRKRKKLIISVLRFPTDDASRQAAEQFDRITNAEPSRHPLAVSAYPQAGVSSGDDITAVGFLAHGPYVIMVNTAVPEPDAGALASIVGRTFQAQTARLDQTTPTPLDDVLDLPLDPDSIMRRTLPQSSDYSDPFFGDSDIGVYAPAAALHFERDPERMRKAFEDSGVDLVARRGGMLYRARDLAGAFRLQNALMTAGRKDEELPPPPGLGDARCLKLDVADETRNFDLFCTVVFDRYVGVVISKAGLTGRMDGTLYQRAAAQYAILANSEGAR